MKRLKKEFVISFTGLKLEAHQFKYQIGKTFFETFHYEDFLDANVQIEVDFLKKPTLFELTFKAKGVINVACDLTNEAFNQPIKADFNLIVKFGETFNDDEESILILPHNAYEFDISQYIYEMLVLSMPVKRVHPGLADGTLKSDIIEKLKELQTKQETGLEDNQIDPRWAKLKTLRTEK